MLNWARGLLGGGSSWASPQPLYGLRPALPAPLRGQLNTATHTDLYRTLRAYYYNNALYDVLRDLLRRQGVWAEALKPIRNPSYRVIEFYPRSLWPGTLPDALPMMTDNPAIIGPIQQVWQWSNWASTKQVAARHLALYGDLFLKVAQTPDRERVFFQTLEPEHVTDFDSDERDFITYCRFDVPMQRRNGDGTTQPYMHTETWSKTTGMYQMWEHDQHATTSIEQLGTPLKAVPIESFGIDFIPVVHAKFADIGDDRGMSALTPALDKIDEANRMATRLHQLLFRHNDAFWALKANSVDASGRPLPPPRINDTDGTTDEDGTVTIGGDRLLKLPGMSELQSLVPNINYEAGLHILQDHMIELEQDLPELVMYRLSEDRTLSGRAVRLMLAPAIARLVEARGNAESALIRADAMALTMGQNAGVFGNLGGTFDGGAFDHRFNERDVLPSDDLERGQAALASAQAVGAYVTAGVPIELAVQEVLGWSEDQAEQFTQDRAEAMLRESALQQKAAPAQLPDEPEAPGE